MNPTHSDVVAQLEDALTVAFPPVAIDRAMIDEPTANWDFYDDYADLAALEGKTWRELPATFLYKHSALLLWAGDAFWRAILPGYLRYLLHERTLFNDLPWQVAGELTRRDDPEYHPKFDRRTAGLSREQRAAIHDVLTLLATVYPLEEAMSCALPTWNAFGSKRESMNQTQPDVVAQLEDALASTFPQVTIDRAMIDEPTALWHVYDDYAELAGFEGKTWRELPAELLNKHSMLLVFAGDTLWRATLPAYLWYVLHGLTQLNALPFQVAGQLTRKDDPDTHPRFDRRIAQLSTAQRATIREVLALLATVPPLEESMSRALETWNNI